MSKTPLNDALMAAGLTENSAFTKLVTMALRDGDGEALREARILSKEYEKKQQAGPSKPLVPRLNPLLERLKAKHV